MTDALAELREWLGSAKVTTSPSVRHSHGRDENFPEVRPPLAVAYAEQVADVQLDLSRLAERLVHHALALGGTASGEHGVPRLTIQRGYFHDHDFPLIEVRLRRLG